MIIYVRGKRDGDVRAWLEDSPTLKKNRQAYDTFRTLTLLYET